jgi:hypothetical protein
MYSLSSSSIKGKILSSRLWKSLLASSQIIIKKTLPAGRGQYRITNYKRQKNAKKKARDDGSYVTTKNGGQNNRLIKKQKKETKYRNWLLGAGGTWLSCLSLKNRKRNKVQKLRSNKQGDTDGRPVLQLHRDGGPTQSKMTNKIHIGKCNGLMIAGNIMELSPKKKRWYESFLLQDRVVDNYHHDATSASIHGEDV